MKVGLYFGSFNPIHTGHLIIASHVFSNVPCNQIWFVVSPQNPFKKQATLLNENQRKHLLDLAIEGDDRFRTSTIEFTLPKPSYTVDTLIHLEEKYPEHEFFIIMGSDSFSNIHKWKNADVLLSNYKIVVYARPGFDVSSKKSSIVILNAPLLNISSTYIRNLIKERKSIRYLVGEKVRVEIENQNYYRDLK